MLTPPSITVAPQDPPVLQFYVDGRGVPNTAEWNVSVIHCGGDPQVYNGQVDLLML